MSCGKFLLGRSPRENSLKGGFFEAPPPPAFADKIVDFSFFFNTAKMGGEGKEGGGLVTGLEMFCGLRQRQRGLWGKIR